jgi:hypothetical protein
MDKLSEFADKFCGVDSEILLRALLISGNARGYILGAVTELLLKQELEGLGFELLRIREKWEGPKKHHGDYYIRRPDSAKWYVLESKGVKSNSEKWHKIGNAPTDPIQLKRWFERKKVGEFYSWWASLDGSLKDKILNSGKFRESKIIETHFVSGTGGRAGREIATPLKAEFNIVALDLFLRTGKHEFIFAKSADLASPIDHPKHLKQNYLIDVLIPTIHETPNIRIPWTRDFNVAFDNLDNPVELEDMQVDDRKPGERAAGIEDIIRVVEEDKWG